jgi:hypothetical protein
VLFVVAAAVFLSSQMGLETFAGEKLKVDTLDYHWEPDRVPPHEAGSLILFVSRCNYYRTNSAYRAPPPDGGPAGGAPVAAPAGPAAPASAWRALAPN